MNYGAKIKILRIENNITQETLAKELGINRSTYKDYELQNATIPIKHLITISAFYQVSIDYLLDLNDLITYPKINYTVNKIEAGKRLKEFRKENKLTQKKLAEMLNTTFSNIAFYEKGRNLIATPFLYEICIKYQVSADYILGRIIEPKYLK